MQFHCNLVRLPNFFANAARRSHFKEKKGNVQFHCNPARRNLNKKKKRNVQFHCNLVHLPNFFANAARRSHFKEKKGNVQFHCNPARRNLNKKKTEMCNFTATWCTCQISLLMRPGAAILKKKRKCAISLQPRAQQFVKKNKKNRNVQFQCNLGTSGLTRPF